MSLNAIETFFDEEARKLLERIVGIELFVDSLKGSKHSTVANAYLDKLRVNHAWLVEQAKFFASDSEGKTR